MPSMRNDRYFLAMTASDPKWRRNRDLFAGFSFNKSRPYAPAQQDMGALQGYGCALYFTLYTFPNGSQMMGLRSWGAWQGPNDSWQARDFHGQYTLARAQALRNYLLSKGFWNM